jgi:cell division protein ZapE
LPEVMRSASAPASSVTLDPHQTGLLGQFQQIARHHGFALDPSQTRALSAFQRLYGELDAVARNRHPWLRRWSRPQRVSGIYLWGPVGRGKSFLMDEFFQLVPCAKKQRAHFHRFMQSIHHGLRELQGEVDPLKIIAARMAHETQLLCLDEFHVTDIGDAMLMRGLLQGLFEERVVLVTTSNQHPDELYAHGLQRAQFLPAIELLKTNLEVLQLDGGSDYRLRTLTRAGVYHQPLSAVAERALAETFHGVAGEPGTGQVRVELEGRQVLARRVAPGTIWFDFAELCEGPRGTADYIELARRYHTVLISGIPRFRPDQSESQQRFTWLVDEFYDRQVKLILSAEETVEGLYDGVPGRTDTERTRSRLIEMQTTRYLSLPHLA